jgi:alpha-L-fucosidase
MKTRSVQSHLLAAALLLSAGSAVCAEPPKPEMAVPELTPERNARLAWWREARFGMFIHWGIYAVPAGEWNGKRVPGIGEWIMQKAQIPLKEYEPFAKGFTGTHFDAEAWAQLAQDAGMKYLVFTAKHHDGFAMYDSKVSSYNVVKATPFARDPVKDLAAACAKRGIVFCAYYSQARDWHDPNGMGNFWDFKPDAEKDFDRYLESKSLPQVRELLTNYGPLGLIWFDGPIQMDVARSARFEKLVRELQPNCIISGRLGLGGFNDYANTNDNRPPNLPVKGDWETPATINRTWGYKKDDLQWKTPAELIFKLVDVVSKGGNYLLNIGPTADGVIPEPSQESLRAMGKWLKTHGEAVYGCTGTAFGDEYGAFSETDMDSKGRPKFIRKQTDWRCTTKPGRIYIHIFNWPDGKLELPTVSAKIKKVSCLADPAGSPMEFKQDQDGVSISVPQKPPCELPAVLCLELVDPAPKTVIRK